MAWVYVMRGDRRYYIGATEDLQRRIAEHQRGSNHTTRRFGGQIELVAAKELPSMIEARKLEQSLKRKKNPRLVLSVLKSAN
jgi:predicted GIY-YIG superfamily endonuclease